MNVNSLLQSLTCCLPEEAIPKTLVVTLFGSINTAIADKFLVNCILHSDENLDINILIDSEGGYNKCMCKIILTLQAYKKLHPTCKIRAYILKQATSAACMIALAADEFYCTDYTLFGPTDLQIQSDNDEHRLNGEIIKECDNLPKNAKLLYFMNYFKNEDAYGTKLLKNILQNHPVYSANAENIFKELNSPEFGHHNYYTLQQMEDFGCKRAGPLSPEILELFTTRPVSQVFTI